LAPVTIEWAHILEDLYSKLPPDVYSKFDALAVAERWHLTSQEPKAVTFENLSLRLGYLGPYGSVRCSLASFAAVNTTSGGETQKIINNSQDVAIRCGGYRQFSFSVDDIKSAIDVDGALACRQFLSNDRIWRSPETRDVLEEACRKLSKDISYDYSLSKEFRIKEEKYKSEYPSFYQVDNVSHDEQLSISDKNMVDIEKFLSESEIFGLITRSIKSQRDTLSWIFWMLVALLIIQLFRL
jgi:hypothetical protein